MHLVIIIEKVSYFSGHTLRQQQHSNRRLGVRIRKSAKRLLDLTLSRLWSHHQKVALSLAVNIADTSKQKSSHRVFICKKREVNMRKRSGAVQRKFHLRWLQRYRLRTKKKAILAHKQRKKKKKKKKKTFEQETDLTGTCLFLCSFATRSHWPPSKKSKNFISVHVIIIIPPRCPLQPPFTTHQFWPTSTPSFRFLSTMYTTIANPIKNPNVALKIVQFQFSSSSS